MRTEKQNYNPVQNVEKEHFSHNTKTDYTVENVVTLNGSQKQMVRNE